MKKLVFALAVSLALGCGSISARGHGHGHHGPHHPPRHPGACAPVPPPPPPRPAPCMVPCVPGAGVYVSFGGLQLWYSNGLYYRVPAPGRYEMAMPPIGMLVDRLYGAQSFWEYGQQYFVSNGIIYIPVATPRGMMYQVVRYL